MKDFINELKKKAVLLKKRIIFPETEDDRILKACEIIKKEKIAIPILVGDPEYVKKKSQELKIDLSGIEIHNPKNFPDYDMYAKTLFELRKDKGMTLIEAHQTLQEPIYLGTMLLYFGRADGIVSGAAHPTAHTLRPALQIIKTKKGISTASSYFIMIKKEEVIFYADCGFNIQPDDKQLAEIAISTADSAKSFGFDAKVAMLSFSTKGSAQHPDADKVIRATKIVKKLRPDIAIDGELQFDAAYVESVGKKKCPDSLIAGKANVFIFPDLDAGNICYKVTERLGGYIALGPIVQGLKKPVNDLSRGCSVEDIVYVTAITAIISDKNQ
ncbi:MAG: phosphate acetyltransferase [Candidatus Woesearchaeota archaeon]